MNSAKKIKILFRIGSLREGGAERVLINLLKHINPDKYEIDLLLNINFGHYVDCVPDYVNLKSINKMVGDNKILKVFNILKLKFFEIFPSLTYNFILNKTYDVEIGFNQLLINDMLKSPNKKSKKILWLHTDVFERGIASLKYISTLSKYNKIVIISEEMRKILLSKTLLTNKSITKIYNALDKNEILNSAKIKVELPFKNDYPVLSNVGSLLKIKGHKLLIEAHKMLIDKGLFHNIVIVGEGPERENIEKLIINLGVQDTVFLAGFQKNPYSYVAQSYFYVHTSYAEGFGNVLIEALYLGKPVLTTNIISAEEILQNSHFGKIVNINALAIAEGIEKLLTKPSLIKLYEENISNGNFAFSLEKSISDFENMIDEQFKL